MQQRGFTLIELLVTISIIGILASIGVYSFGVAQAAARDAKRKQDLKQIQTAIEEYHTENNTYPGSVPGWRTYIIGGCDNSVLSVLTQTSGTTPPFISKMPDDPKTGWHYFYEKVSDDKYILASGLENTDDKDGTVTVPPEFAGSCAPTFPPSGATAYYVIRN